MQSTQGDPPFKTAGKKIHKFAIGQYLQLLLSGDALNVFAEILPPIPRLNKASNVASVIIQPY